jgi:hypothetical protein
MIEQLLIPGKDSASRHSSYCRIFTTLYGISVVAAPGAALCYPGNTASLRLSAKAYKIMMPSQPEPSLPTPSAPAARARVTTSAAASPSVAPAEIPLTRQDPPRIPVWLERGELFLRVLLRMYIGLAISFAPWIPYFWDRNPLFEQFPTLAILAANGAVRGVVSGLGILNLWYAIQDALHSRSEHK